MKKILPIICLAWLLLSCNSEQKYRQLAEEFLKDIPSERVIATFTDVDRHCIFYIEEAEFDEGKTFLVEGDAGGDKYHNIIKYDLKTKESPDKRYCICPGIPFSRSLFSWFHVFL